MESKSAESVSQVPMSPVFKVACSGGKGSFDRPVHLQLPHSSATVDDLKVCCLRRLFLSNKALHRILNAGDASR